MFLSCDLLVSLPATLAGTRLEFALIDGPDRACRGSGASDNNPAHYTVAEGAWSWSHETHVS